MSLHKIKHNLYQFAAKKLEKLFKINALILH